MKIKILYAVKNGDADWQEVIITSTESGKDRIAEASKWALANGFGRLRIATHVDGEMPDFAGTVK